MFIMFYYVRNNQLLQYSSSPTMPYPVCLVTAVGSSGSV